MTTVNFGSPDEWSVDLGPPTAGFCPQCGKAVFKEGALWWDEEGWRGGTLWLVPDQPWHNHSQPKYQRPVAGVVLRRSRLVQVTRR